MPKSKTRKKKGKKVAYDANRSYRSEESRRKAFDEQESGVSFQDLINVLAYQEYVKDGTIIADDVVINIPDSIPVTVGEGESKRQIGTATPIPGDPGAVSVHIDDLADFEVSDTHHEYSIDPKENI